MRIVSRYALCSAKRLTCPSFRGLRHEQQPDAQSAHGKASRKRSSGQPCGRTSRSSDRRRVRRRCPASGSDGSDGPASQPSAPACQRRPGPASQTDRTRLAVRSTISNSFGRITVRRDLPETHEVRPKAAAVLHGELPIGSCEPKMDIWAIIEIRIVRSCCRRLSSVRWSRESS